jgi:zinc transport system permease protein
MIADTLGHVSLTGVAIGLLTGLPPMLTTVAYSLASAVGIDLLRAGKRTPSDATLSLFLSGNLALAILLLNLSGNFGTNLHAYLFGSILTVGSADVWALAGLAAGVLACVFFFYRQILVVCMDGDYAAAQGIPVRYVDLGLVLLISLTVTASLPVVGLLLV